MEGLTNDDMDCIQELNRFISELVRLGNSAIWKAKRQLKIKEHDRDGHDRALRLGYKVFDL